MTQALETTLSAGASKATGAGSGIAVAGWATSSDLGLYFGIAVGLAGLAVNWYYKRKADKREQQLHEVNLKKAEIGAQIAAVELQEEKLDLAAQQRERQ